MRAHPRFIRLFSLAVVILAAAVIDAYAQSDLVGSWEGAVERYGKRWRVNMRVSKIGEGFKARVDFPDADGYGREFTVAIDPNGRILLKRPQPSGVPIIFDGIVRDRRFSGTWSGFGQTAAFSLVPMSWAEPEWPDKEVTFKNGNVTLAGSLITPHRDGPFPAIVLTHGGDQKERSTNRSWALHFIRAGFAVLIYDKRGSGASTGDTRSASMEDLAGDASAAVTFLAARPEIDPERVGVAGHSQGGWVAPLASTMNEKVAFVIASAASGVSPDKQSIYHRANVMRMAGFPEETIALASDLRRRLYVTGRMLLDGDPRVATERKKTSDELSKYANEPWLDEAALPPNLQNDNPTPGGLKLLFFEPGPMWAKVKVPVLLIWGDKDTVVPVDEGRANIETALQSAGNRSVTVKTFPNVDHAVAVVPAKGEWDFPRVALDYYKYMVEWASRTAER